MGGNTLRRNRDNDKIYDHESLRDERKYGFYWYSGLWRVLRPILIGAGALLLSLVIGGLLARRISRPITKTVDIAKQIAQGHYDIHFEGQTKTSELHQLMSSLNYLAEALARQEAMRKQLTADVAHELRTPLATLGSHLEAMIEGVWQPTQERLTSCHEEIIRLGKLVRDLERLERAEDKLNDIQRLKSAVNSLKVWTLFTYHIRKILHNIFVFN